MDVDFVAWIGLALRWFHVMAGVMWIAWKKEMVNGESYIAGLLWIGTKTALVIRSWMRGCFPLCSYVVVVVMMIQCF